MAYIIALTTVADREIPEGDTQEQTATRKVQKFIFEKDTKHILLQAVHEHDVHRVPHGRNDDAFEKVEDILIQNLPEAT